jgi:hypothetical protein
VAVISYHQELIPTSLLVTIASTRDRVPFPALVEALVILRDQILDIDQLNASLQMGVGLKHMIPSFILDVIVFFRQKKTADLLPLSAVSLTDYF